MKRMSILAVFMAMLSACSSEPTKPVAVSSSPASAAAPSPPPARVTPTTPPAAVETEAQRIARGLKTLGGKSIYFDYDDYTIKTDYQSLIKQHFELLRDAPTHSLTLEGNADERGSVEYNLALGQKRAEAVRRSMKMMGLPDVRVEAISYGKEKPRATCHEEKCWAENRRVDFEYKKLPGSK